MKRVQIICTIGPASEKPEILEQLILSGMDVARFNFSHATFSQYTQSKRLIESFNKKHNKSVQTLMDLQGPRMRVGVLPDEGVELKDGDIILFSTNSLKQNAIFINHSALHEDIEVKHPLYLANGELELVVVEKNGTEIKARVVRGGLLYSRKAVNVPETDLSISGITEKDIKDIEFGIKSGVDLIALSFVKDAQDLKFLREKINDPKIKIISKIERKQALINLEEIIDASDLVMVARGDLGIEVALEEIPLLQKEIILTAKRHGKPSIVATQMLLSMVTHARPTRAEVSDVANAVLDGADYVMLSEETAFGKYPIEACEFLLKTVRHVEEFQKKLTKNHKRNS